jgi:hypothetical protein
MPTRLKAKHRVVVADREEGVVGPGRVGGRDPVAAGVAGHKAELDLLEVGEPVAVCVTALDAAGEDRGGEQLRELAVADVVPAGV